MFRKVISVLTAIIMSILSTVAVISLYQSFTYTSWPIILITFLVVLLFYLLAVSKFLNNPMVYGTFFKRPLIFSFTMIFSLLLFFSLKSPMGYLDDNLWITIAYVYIFAYLTIYAGVSFILYYLVHHSMPVQLKPVSRWKILLYAIPAILIWSVYLIGFFPGNMSPDSISHWRQLNTHEFSNWHPVMYTWYMMLLALIWKSPAMIAISQIVILAFIIGYGLFSLERNGVSSKWLWLITIVFAISPINGIFSIILWKDILYSAFLLLFTILMFNVVASKGRWLVSNWHLFLLALTVLGVVF